MNTAVPSPYPSQGEEVDGRYRVERVLGEGGMGMVARAVDLLMRQTVAIKFMNPQFMTFPGAKERFLQEAQASVAIKSEHVVHTLNVGKLPTGAPYMVMPCLEGKDLADLLAHEGSPGLATPRAVHFVLQILRGLQAAHAVGIVHRDMKPSNCFVVKHEGEPDFVKILDFGISKVREPGSASLTQTNSALGTPLYMSPEQAKSPRDVDGRSDIYSVGVILYELLTGHTPFFSESGEFTEILFKLFTADPPPVKSTRPDLPDALAAAVHKALARDLNERFASAQELADALAPFADARSSHILTRIRNFTPEQARSMPPPDGVSLPGSMEVFSRLDAKPATDVMANRPTTDVQRSAPFTQVMDSAPGRIVVTPATPMTPAAGGASVAAAGDARVTGAADMMARTQYDSIPETPRSAVAVGASTDLGATRDAPIEAPAPRRSPAVYLLPVFAIILIVGIGAALVAQRNGKTPPTVATSEPETATTTLPPPSAPSATPSAAPSVVASSSASAPAPTTTVPDTKHTAAATTTTPTAKPTSNAAKATGLGLQE